jgi:lipoprotein-anchoring transpeptidase ErfK/SrfK
MPQISRRDMLVGGGGTVIATSFGACVPHQPIGASIGQVAATPNLPPPETEELVDQQPDMPVPAERRAVATAAYGPVQGERFPVPAAPLSRINPAFLRARVAYARGEKPGTIVIDPGARYLYFVEEGGRAMRYGVGVGKEGFAWSGKAVVHDKQEWPDWYPPKEMIQRRPDLRSQLTELQSGIGVPGGPSNPLGARAMYLWQGNKDTLYRIHGTNEPWTIGTSVSSGCIRMIDQDAIDLYARTATGTNVIVLTPRAPARVG